MLMQQAEIDLIRPPLPVARVGRWGDGASVATEGAFQLRHETSTPQGGVGTSLKLLMVCVSGRRSNHGPGLVQLLGGVHRQRCALHRERGDGVTGLDQSQLLQAFKILQR